MLVGIVAGKDRKVRGVEVGVLFIKRRKSAQQPLKVAKVALLVPEKDTSSPGVFYFQAPASALRPAFSPAY